MLGNMEAVCVGPHEQRVLRIPLENVVGQEVHTHAGLEDVLAALVEAGVRQIVADGGTLLDEILGAVVAADPCGEVAAKKLSD